MEVKRVPKWFGFLFEDYSSEEGSSTKKRSRGLIFLITAQIWLLFFIPYISPFVADEHLLGKWGFAVADFFIRTLFGISAFSIPLAFVMLGLHDLYRKPNLSVTLQQITALGFFLFAFNIALLNTALIFTPWAGLFPHFFHALIVHYLGENATNNALSIVFELSLVFVSLTFVMISFRWHHQWKMKKIKSFEICIKENS